MQFIQRYHDNSLTYGTPQAERISQAAKDHRIMVVMGHSEKRGGSLYMGQWIIDADGHTVAQRRKLKPTHVERTVFGEGDGSDLAVHDTDARPRRRAVLLGAPAAAVEVRDVRAERAGAHRSVAELFAVPRRRLRARPRGQQRRQPHLRGRGPVLRDRAVRDGVSKEMIDMLCGDDPMKKQLLLEGGGFAAIYAPDGQLMHEPLPEKTEGLVYADIDLGMISLAKAAADPAGHYARPDVTRLLFDKTPGDRVVLRQRHAQEVTRSGGDGEQAVPMPEASAAAQALRA